MEAKGNGAWNDSYFAKVKDLLSDAPVISVVSTEMFDQMYRDNKVAELREFAINVARITEGKLSKLRNYSEADVTSIFENTIKTLCDINDKSSEHFTWLSVKALHSAWIYGEIVRKWWNQKYLSGEEGTLFKDVYNYLEPKRSISYRIRPRA